MLKEIGQESDFERLAIVGKIRLFPAPKQLLDCEVGNKIKLTSRRIKAHEAFMFSDGRACVDLTQTRQPRGNFQVVSRGLPSRIEYQIEGSHIKNVGSSGSVKFIILEKLSGVKGAKPQFITHCAFYDPS